VSGYADSRLASIGENLKRIRGDEDQKAVAKRMGIPQARLSNWEKNRYRTVSVRTLLWLAKGYRCGVEQLVQGLDAEYDAGRDLLGQGRTVESSPHQGGADVPASARVRELQDRVDAYEAVLARVRLVVGELTAAIGGEGHAVARVETRRRRRR